ncbi:hypothetical protein [Thalassospira profundimaris]|uniref:hypothetical protein n=1 Tax=Thalassospira profundimaris TaxID=502049 RepID=UPI0011BFB08A|nr:hypothetical protein [Thalassospira profundimaris]
MFSQPETQDNARNTDDKEQIEEVVREFILCNPDVIIQAMQTHGNNQRAAQPRRRSRWHWGHHRRRGGEYCRRRHFLWRRSAHCAALPLQS